MNMTWQRVTKQNPCPRCGKPDWCMIAPRGDVVLCMREPSDKPHVLKSGEVGYFHPVADVSGRPERPKPAPEPVINVSKLMERYHAQTEWAEIVCLAEQLGVMPTALAKLGCAWAAEHRAWAFPMADAYGNPVGIRLRTSDGHKFAVRGSHSGIFLPGCEPERMALICEGPTDTSAALSLGFYAIGRPSCSGGVHDIIGTFRRLHITSAVIVADSDGPGMQGALMLQKHLPVRSALIVLPSKDLRFFLQLGGTRELLDSMIGQLVWDTR